MSGAFLHIFSIVSNKDFFHIFVIKTMIVNFDSLYEIHVRLHNMKSYIILYYNVLNHSHLGWVNALGEEGFRVDSQWWGVVKKRKSPDFRSPDERLASLSG